MLSKPQHDLIEERAEEVISPQNRATLRSLLGNLFSRSEKGNWAHYKLEDEWGFTGDFCPHDWGNEPK